MPKTTLNSPALIPLYLAMMAVGMGQTVVFAVIPMLGRELGLHEMVFHLPLFGEVQPREMAITTLSALTAFVFFLVSPFWGRMSDRYGRKPIIITGLIGYTLGTLAFNGVVSLGFSGALAGLGLYLMLILSRVFHSSIMSATHPASSSYMVGVTSVADRTRGMARLHAFNQLGVMVGPALAWLVVVDFLAPLYLQAFLCAMVAILVWRYLPASEPPSAAAIAAPRLRFHDRRIRVFLFFAFAFYSLLGMVQQTLGFYFQDTLQLEAGRATQYYSMAMMASSAAMLFAQLGLVSRYRGEPLNLLRVGLPFSFIGYVLLAYAGSLGALLGAMALFGFGMGLVSPGFGAAATMTVKPQEQGALAGLMGAAAGLGFVFGPMLGGWLYQYEPSWPYAAAAICLLPLIVFSFFFRPQLPKSD